MTAFVSLALIGAGAAGTVALARVLGLGRRLTALMLGTYALRVCVAVALYVISAWQLPVLRSLQLGDGFWRFSHDSVAYHWLGVEVAERFRWGTELPTFAFYGDPDFFLFVGALYRVIGSHPLYLPLINAAVGSVLLALVYVLASRLNGGRGAAAAMVLVALWPSSYLWSSQVMKDMLVLSMVLWLLLLMGLTFERRDRYPQFAALWVITAPVLFMLVRFRSYIVLLAALTAIAVVLLRAVVPGRAGLLRTAVAGGLMAALFLGTFALSRGIDMVVLATPGNPSEGHLRKAQYLDSRGERDEAEWERLRASGAVASWPIDATPEEVRRYRLEHPSPEGYEVLFGSARYPDAQRALNAIHEFKSGESIATPENGRKAKEIYAERQAAGLVEPPTDPGGRWNFRRGWNQLISSFSLGSLASLRRGFTQTFEGGTSTGMLTTTVSEVTSVRELIAAVPLGMANALWAPFPWQWVGGGGETGAFRQVAGVETLAILALTPWFVRALVHGLRSKREAAWLLIMFTVGSAAVMGIAVGGVGILFRLRLQFLFPLLVLGGAYGLADWRVVRLLFPDAAALNGDSALATEGRQA